MAASVLAASCRAGVGCRGQRPLLRLRGLCRGASCSSAGGKTHFGFQTVSEAEKGAKVYKIFENVAKKYDLMNDSMSLGIHRVWKDILLRQMNPYPGTQLLDAAGGTGDIAFRFIDYVRSRWEYQVRQKLRSHQNLSWQEITSLYQEEEHGSLGGSHVVVCDINKEMLKIGKQKSQQLGYSDEVPGQSSAAHPLFCTAPGLSWVLGNAEELPFNDDSFDIYTIAFGIRNVTHIDQALQEAFRVLKPGGRFLCLEFSQVNNSLISSLYDLYSFQVIPVLGEVIAGDWKAYQYLVESIRNFPTQETFKEMIEDAGFLKVDYQNLGSGIVAIHSGFKL
ncbi:2-methoxy-6-polyprenyl-1,4-benzoquinol methylase, mitochondrial isoform X1 [Varanus komodoensis]|uniref:2-methoxy-6-polyprenyl-1,4-benzoquinol methylase, mitochondrial isoform X1 n=1 Tax=Varanus komodoensis TaxID=61221 RepID=UPI001CF7A5B4|nr:2-methoxy-6-polyprenyl-1,4-benzoquinol methylase, mitochondrial isoform X1 [Varanus komodoensis]